MNCAVCDTNPAANRSRADLRAAAEALRRLSFLLGAAQFFAIVGTVLARDKTCALSCRLRRRRGRAHLRNQLQPTQRHPVASTIGTRYIQWVEIQSVTSAGVSSPVPRESVMGTSGGNGDGGGGEGGGGNGGGGEGDGGEGEGGGGEGGGGPEAAHL